MRIFIFIGAPGSGKGTLSNLVKEQHKYDHLSTGDLLRAEVQAETELGLRIKSIIDGGNFVDDDTMIELLEKRVASSKAPALILDGFPRTLPQAEALEVLAAKLDKELSPVYFEVPEDILIERICNRRVHLASGRVYNTTLNPPETPDCDDITGEPLIQRDDDNPEVFEKRYDTYMALTTPVIEMFRKKGQLVTIDSARSPDEILKDFNQIFDL